MQPSPGVIHGAHIAFRCHFPDFALLFCFLHISCDSTSDQPWYLSSLLLAGCTGCLQAQLAFVATLDLSIQGMPWEWLEMGAHLQQPAAGAAEGLTCHKSGRQTTKQNTLGPSVWKAASSSQHSEHKRSSVFTKHLCHTACIIPTASCQKGLFSCRD